MVKSDEIRNKAKKIKLLLTDVDGVLTDTGVYYSSEGEELKRFSIRDGMGVERLRNCVGIETGIITGENSPIVKRRAQKLNINEVYLGIKNKLDILLKVCNEKNLSLDEIAYIGDDLNDIEIIKSVGLSACPNDALSQIKEIVDYITENNGGYGAFRDFCELIILSKNN